MPPVVIVMGFGLGTLFLTMFLVSNPTMAAAIGAGSLVIAGILKWRKRV